jgi:hypothetical protein
VPLVLTVIVPGAPGSPNAVNPPPPVVSDASGAVAPMSRVKIVANDDATLSARGVAANALSIVPLKNTMPAPPSTLRF